MTEPLAPGPEISSSEGTMPGPSVARNSVSKLTADGAVLVCGLISGLISARWLGPAGKGVLSSLLFAAALSSQIGTLGLGDSAMILTGRGQISIRKAARDALFPLVLSSSVLACLFLLVWVVQFPVQWESYRSAVVVAAFLIPVGTGAYFLTALLNAEERFTFSSLVNGGVAAAALVGFVSAGVFGRASVLVAVSAGLIASSAGLSLLFAGVLRSVNRGGVAFAGPGLRLGLPIQVSNILVSMCQRLDQLLVFSFAGPASAGHYSVAITLGQLIVYAPFAMSTASFPRIASLESSLVPEFVARSFRISVVSMVLFTPILSTGIFFGTTFVFGSAYAPAICPALILSLGGALWISQWLLTRALAARGQTRPLLQSFGASLGLMVVLNRVLIPHWGLNGAAIASTSGAAIGFSLALRAAFRAFSGELAIRRLAPTARDLQDVAQVVTRGVRRLMTPFQRN